MRQIEITTRVNNTLQEVEDILTKQGFKVIRKSRIEDKYLTQHINELKKDNIIDILKNSVLLRYWRVNNKEVHKTITYKNKVYENDIVISEEKISINIDDIDNAEKLFTLLGFKKLVDVNYDIIVYEKDGFELCFQDVERLGLVLEYENENDFTNVSNEGILKVKHEMLEKIKKYNLNITDEFDIKKAYELIEKEID